MTPVALAPTPPILIVDDDPVFRMLTRDALTDAGLSVIEAADGIEGFQYCCEAGPSLVVVDVMMPKMDGFALCRELRERAATRNTPILVITGLDDHGALFKAYEAGATDFIVKPIDWRSLAQRVRDMLRHADAAVADEPPEPLMPGEPSGPTGAIVDRASPPADEGAPGRVGQPLSILIVDDDPVIRSLTRDTLENEGYDVVEAENGLAAYKACQHIVPAMIIADVLMPGMDGFELCRQLRQRPETAQVPILMATGLRDHQSVATAYHAGATDFIAKPIDWVVLRYRLRYMLRAASAFADLVAAKERAEAADRAKSTFLANMSHELRTPLNAVIGFSQIMHEQVLGPISAQYAEYAKIIGDSGSHLLTIINDILDIAKAEAQGLRLGEEEVHIPEIVSFSAAMVEAMARDAGISFSVNVEKALPAFRGDGKKVQQILINLLANAIKFTPGGGTVTLTAGRGQGGDGLVFQIADTGIGIPPDKIAVALAPFGQIDSPLARKNDGVGLGLPLTKRLVELHDGILDIDSQPGVGTIVTIRFPPGRFVPGAAGSAIN